MATIVGVVGITGALLVASFSLLAPEEASDRQVARNAVSVASPAHKSAGDLVARRVSYPYSVVPGGVHSSEDLARARADRVVAEHYAAVDLRAVRVQTVRASRRVHVSYRIGDEIYWTKRTLLLSPGERILTDGRIEIRSRCGNIISETPQEPTADEEPSITEFDRLIASADPEPPPSGISEGPPPAGVVPAMTANGDAPADAPNPQSGGTTDGDAALLPLFLPIGGFFVPGRGDTTPSGPVKQAIPRRSETGSDPGDNGGPVDGRPREDEGGGPGAGGPGSASPPYGAPELDATSGVAALALLAGALLVLRGRRVRSGSD